MRERAKPGVDVTGVVWSLEPRPGARDSSTWSSVRAAKTCSGYRHGPPGSRWCKTRCMSVHGSVRARRVGVTEATDSLAKPDYASAFEVVIRGVDVRSPEQWVRATFEDAPRAMRWLVVVGWRYVLGLRLGPRSSPAYVLGWKIVLATPDAITLEVRSALVTATKVLRVEGSRVRMTTFVHYERRVGRALWSAIAPVHHQTEPYLLGHAASYPRSATS